jgi:hypothetical protein
MAFDVEYVGEKISQMVHGMGNQFTHRELSKHIEQAAYDEAKFEVEEYNQRGGNDVFVGSLDWFLDRGEELENSRLYALYYANQSMMYAQALAWASTRERHWRVQ